MWCGLSGRDATGAIEMIALGRMAVDVECDRPAV
jgi:hypothetical protein